MSIGTLAASYAARGWKIVRLWGVKSPAVCTCSLGAHCGTPGKHPVAAAWHTRTSSDEEEIASWFDGGKPVNIGLLLGPLSGVVDVELDGDEAKEAWEALGLGEIYTPTYTAGRGPHRLFRWEDGLPDVAVKKVGPIEVRLGNGGRAAQSVLPPSTHHTGKRYEWVSGLSPDDVEVMPLPEKLVALLWNDDGSGLGGSAPRGRPTRLALSSEIPQGARNNEVYRFAVREAFRCGPDLDSQVEQQDLLLKIKAVNVTSCKPPLSTEEVSAIFRSAIRYVRKSRAAGMPMDAAIQRVEEGEATADEPSPEDAAAGEDGDEEGSTRKGRRKKSDAPKQWVQVFCETGLAYAPLVPNSGSESEWGPGEWSLTVVHSDPLEYRLHVPAWKQWTANSTGNISLSVDQYRSAPKVAAAVLAATGVIMLDDEPGKWRRIWDGGYKVEDSSGKKRIARGVKAKLLDNVDHEWPGASSLRYVHLAGWMYDRLSQASQPSDDDTPDPTGRAAWRSDGTLWFSWSKIWEDVERQHRVNEGERLALKRRLLALLNGAKDFNHAEFRHAGGTRRSYVVWTRREFSVLEALATEGGTAAAEVI